MASTPESRDLTAQADEFAARTRAAAEQVRAQGEKRRVERERHDNDVAAARRRGEQGRDWQVLQQRIDMKRTTFTDIAFGMDHSAEARAVRKLMAAGLGRGRDRYYAELADPNSTISRAVNARVHPGDSR